MQSIQQTVQLTCPNCFQTEEKVIYQRLVVEELPKLKNKVMDGSLFAHKCKYCKHTYATPYSNMYISKKLKLVIICAVTKQEYETTIKLANSGSIHRQMMNSINEVGSIRIVKNPIELAEKVAIFESHYDDRLMEVLKYDLMESLKDHHENVEALFYKKNQKGGMFAVVRSNGKVSAIEFQNRWYQDVARRYTSFLKDSKKQFIVDRTFAEQFLKPLPFQEEGEAVGIQ